MVHDRLMDEEHLAPYKTLILPNIAALSDQQCQQIRDFVRKGGSLVATYETSLYNEMGERRDNFGLSDLFGVELRERAGRAAAKFVSGHRTRRGRTAVSTRWWPAWKKSGRIINGVNWITVESNHSPMPNPPLTLIPSYPDLPMEMVWVRVPQTDIPGRVTRANLAKGRVVYFPWDIDRTFWEVLCMDHGKLLSNAVNWATNEEAAGHGHRALAFWM